jgi:hypothetical protein
MGAAVSAGKDDREDDGAAGFLNRWARLKRAGGESVEGDAVAEDASAEETGKAGAEAGADVEPEVPAEPVPDPDLIASLPRIEDITADTDITAFLRSGVPRALRNAALRRAWAADPRIANYLDPARDYFWDWNAPAGVPGGIPGGGGTLGADAVAKMLRAVVGSAPDADPEGDAPGPAATADPTPDASAGPSADPMQGPEGRGAMTPQEPATGVDDNRDPAAEPAISDRAVGNGATQNEPQGAPRPRHGGAMPA